MLKWVADHQAADEVSIYDAGFKLADLQQAGVKRYVVRQSANGTVRRNYLPDYKGKGRPPKFGELIRPLARSYKGKTIAASLPDAINSFEFENRTIEVHSWFNVVRSDQEAGQTVTFNIFVFFDPNYIKPLVLAIDITLSVEASYLFYKDRWPVEQPPLVTKQLLGCKRAFVFNSESVFRLPELALLTGNILTYLAATSPVIPTGFWDRNPKKRQVAFVGL